MSKRHFTVHKRPNPELVKYFSVSKVVRLLVFGITINFINVGLVYGQYSSPGYRIEETIFGSGGELDSASTNFRAQQGAGALGVGQTSSNNYDAFGGLITTNEPFLEMVVSNVSVDLGVLSDATTSSGAAQGGACNCSFYVRTYNTSGYIVVTVSQPPATNGGSVLDAKGTQGSPSADPNVEEFGINLRDNTAPNIGGDAVNVPDNSFADGQAASGYDIPDQFKYGVGDTLARSQATIGNPAIGQTNYTISYIAKANTVTPAGNHIMDHDLVVVATF
jgi:hypothetical protein